MDRGIGILETAEHLRNYYWLSRRSIKILAGWFLRFRSYETKYKLAYHLYDTSEHVSWLLDRLGEMRGGNPNASIRPELKELMEAVLSAPSDNAFLAGYYGVLQRSLIAAIKSDIEKMDTSGNANEIRILGRVLEDLESQRNWFDSLGLEWENSKWVGYLQQYVAFIGGLHGSDERESRPEDPEGMAFSRPSRILFDERIQIGPLESYESRSSMERQQATIEQFKVFFNEFYAAALLAGVLFDASDEDYPWALLADFSRHFWDEARHSEFGSIRLRELGCEPGRINPVLFEESHGLPVLHRIAYLTRGLEAYFMPRKGKRFKEYESSGDHRSQFFADQDWSDEINHVRYGNKWVEYLLQDDHRDLDDILQEVKDHLAKVRKQPVESIDAPF